MTVTTLYPGVYVQEIPSGVRAITGVATSITAFVGRTRRGPVNRATTVNSYADYERVFGGLWADSSVGYAVRDFFVNGGGQAIVVRLARNATVATIDVGDLHLEADGAGSWGDELRVSVDQAVAAEVAQRLGVAPTDLFNLTVTDRATGAREVFRNLTVVPSSRNIAD